MRVRLHQYGSTQAFAAAVIVVHDPAPVFELHRGPSLRAPLAHAAAVTEAAVARADRVGETRPPGGGRSGEAVAAGAIDVRARSSTEKIVELCRIFGAEDLPVLHDDCSARDIRCAVSGERRVGV